MHDGMNATHSWCNHLQPRWLGCLLAFGVFACLAGCDDTAPPAQSIESKHLAGEKSDQAALVQGRISAQDECPKLVQKRIDRTSVSRQEQILGNACDYFIYPNVGEVVSVSVSDSRMKPYLDIPYYHNFANGDYVVVASGRHVIRLEYDSLERKPNIMNYVLEVNIRPQNQ